jgi:hypothetical protein
LAPQQKRQSLDLVQPILGERRDYSFLGKIMVVDDNRLNRRALGIYFAKMVKEPKLNLGVARGRDQRDQKEDCRAEGWTEGGTKEGPKRDQRNIRYQRDSGDLKEQGVTRTHGPEWSGERTGAGSRTGRTRRTRGDTKETWETGRNREKEEET